MSVSLFGECPFKSPKFFGSFYDDKNKEALKMIESIIKFSEKYNNRPGKVYSFNIDFPISVRSRINDDNEDVTDKQLEALENIIRKWRIKP